MSVPYGAITAPDGSVCADEEATETAQQIVVAGVARQLAPLDQPRDQQRGRARWRTAADG